mgnify:CR=1 FL=1
MLFFDVNDLITGVNKLKWVVNMKIITVCKLYIIWIYVFVNCYELVNCHPI